MLSTVTHLPLSYEALVASYQNSGVGSSMYNLVNEKLFPMLPTYARFCHVWSGTWVNRAPTCHGPWPPFGAERPGHRLVEVAPLLYGVCPVSYGKPALEGGVA